MSSLFLLIALYTIAGKQATLSGEAPEGSTYLYEQTGSRSGQMTAANEIVLTLSGYEGTRLQSITIEMHSNTSAGAGSMELTVGGAPLWTITDQPFSSNGWYGAYSTEWVEITQPLSGRTVAASEDIQLHIVASVNSLYLRSVAIEYTAPEVQAYTVAFDTHASQRVASITERQPGAGVVLPECPIADEQWSFFGWAATAQAETTYVPQVFREGQVFHPSGDCTLHAVYRQQQEQTYWYAADELSTGDYLMFLYVPDGYAMYMASGKVTNGLITAIPYLFYDVPTDPIPMQASYSEQEVYTLTMLTDSTLTIKHRQTDTGVVLGTGSKFKSSGSQAWQLYSKYSETDGMTRHFLSAQAGTKTYYVSVSLVGESICFRPMENANTYGLLLYALQDEPDQQETTYSSYPFAQDGVSNIGVDHMPPFRMNVGPGTLIIHNGQKTLQIHE